MYSGTFMTSLNGNGFSISILKLVETGLGQGKSMLELLDASQETIAWNSSISPSTWEGKDTAENPVAVADDEENFASELRSKLGLLLLSCPPPPLNFPEQSSNILY